MVAAQGMMAERFDHLEICYYMRKPQRGLYDSTMTGAGGRLAM
jgi:hypothetical protein